MKRDKDGNKVQVLRNSRKTQKKMENKRETTKRPRE